MDDLSYPMIRDAVRTNPKVLIALKDPKKIKYANSFLPKDTGIEFEVGFKIDNTIGDIESERTRVYKKSSEIDYSLIRNIEMKFNRDFNGYPEKRFRIKSGVKGMIQLFNISKFLTKYAELNDKSIIHMHVGSEKHPSLNWYNQRTPGSILDVSNKYIHLFDPSIFKFKTLLELNKATWLNYNTRFSTMEYRGVPLSFSYSHLIKYAILCQKITAYINKF